jgi:hypothetical protein
MKELLKRVDHIVFLVSGQCFVFDKNREQIPELQLYFTEGKQNIKMLRRIANNANSFTVGKWKEWFFDLTKEEFFSLTNLNK